MYQYGAKLVRVIDGDTVVLDVDLGFKLSRLNEPYRLLRIDAPEMRTAEGPPSRDALAAFLAGKRLEAWTQKSDSFGRFLAEVYADGINASDWLVASGHAVYRSY